MGGTHGMLEPREAIAFAGRTVPTPASGLATEDALGGAGAGRALRHQAVGKCGKNGDRGSVDVPRNADRVSGVVSGGVGDPVGVA